MGSIATMLYFYALTLVIIAIMAALVRINDNQKLKKYYNILFQQAFFGDLFAILIDSYYEILVSAYL